MASLIQGLIDLCQDPADGGGGVCGEVGRCLGEIGPTDLRCIAIPTTGDTQSKWVWLHCKSHDAPESGRGHDPRMCVALYVTLLSQLSIRPLSFKAHLTPVLCHLAGPTACVAQL